MCNPNLFVQISKTNYYDFKSPYSTNQFQKKPLFFSENMSKDFTMH